MKFVNTLQENKLAGVHLYSIKNDLKNIQNDTHGYFSQFNKITSQKIFSIIGFFSLFAFGFFIDNDVRIFVQSIRTPSLDNLFGLFHWYGKSYIPIASIIIFYGSGLILSKPNWRIFGIKIFETYAFSGIIVTSLKSIFGRWRPYTEHGNFSFQFFTLGPNEHLSLPSGDVAIAFTFSMIAASVYNNKLWKSMWYVFALIAAVGRIYHDQHWFSDTILAAGVAISFGYYIVRQQYRENF